MDTHVALYIVVIVLFTFGTISSWLAIFHPSWFAASRRMGSKYTSEMGRVIYSIEAIFCLVLALIILIDLLFK